MMKWLCFLLTLFFSLQLASAQTFSQTFGGVNDEHGLEVLQTRSGDMVVVGFTNSFGAGKTDIWVLKVDRRGNEKWRTYIGEQEDDWPRALIQSRDGGFVVAGYTQDPASGSKNAWVFKLDDFGNILWSETFGGEHTDVARCIIQTQDGGYAVGGFSNSFSRGKSDVWLLRLNENGKELWSKNYGAKGSEEAYSIVETSDAGLVMGGYTRSYGNGGADILVMKVDKNGNELWRRNYGGARNEVAEDMLISQDGYLMLAGWTASEGMGSLDGTLLKLDQEGVYQWQLTYGGAGKDGFSSLTRTLDGGYAVAGFTSSYGLENKGLWMLRLDAQGQVKWEQRVGGQKDDYGHDIIQTQDGGFAVAGGTKGFSEMGGSDLLLLKTDRTGRFEGGAGVFNQQLAVNQPVPNQIKETAPSIEPTDPAYKPNLYILTIGVSEYEDAGVNLTFAHSDAEAFADRFSEMEGKIFNRVEVRKLLNREATLVNIRTGISWLERQATQRDVILIFVSSHGALDHKGNLYILPTDFNSYNLFATALNIRDLTEGINAVPCKKLVMLDACHSGQSGQDLLDFASLKAVDLDQIVQDLIDREPGLTVMTSSSGREYSYETIKWGHGAFTMAILEGLEGNADVNGDSVIDLNELNLYVSERVKTLTRGRQHPFTPINLFGNIPLFVLD